MTRVSRSVFVFPKKMKWHWNYCMPFSGFCCPNNHQIVTYFKALFQLLREIILKMPWKYLNSFLFSLYFREAIILPSQTFHAICSISFFLLFDFFIDGLKWNWSAIWKHIIYDVWGPPYCNVNHISTALPTDRCSNNVKIRTFGGISKSQSKCMNAFWVEKNRNIHNLSRTNNLIPIYNQKHYLK